jgi:RNA polymerase sigma-70 factor (ECF subfamily)
MRAADWFDAHERFIWGLAYRMTGSAADADDVRQETFARAVERPPPRVDEDMRPWLARVACNLARDVLRRRKRPGYVGPWLPAPIDDDVERSSPDAGAVYDKHEGAAYAFLVALETLSPGQRAVLLLREVFEYSVRETAGVLEMSETQVKVTHHRARKKMAAAPILLPSTSENAHTQAALERFLAALMTNDPAAVEACLADGVRAVSDGGGEFTAALRPVNGKARVTRFFLGVQKKFRPKGVFELRTLNGEPALVADFESDVAGAAPRWVMRCQADGEGRVTQLHILLATRKLTHVRRVGAS